MKKIAIIGGPYAGKTTIINELAKQGYKTVPEAALQIIQELNGKLGIEGQKNWRLQNYNNFQIKIIKRYLELEPKNIKPDDIIFYDSSVYTNIAFYKFLKIKPARLVIDMVDNYFRFDMIFLLETLSSFNQRKETGRITNKYGTQILYDLIKETYLDYGHQITAVKEMPVAERIKFIKKHIEQFIPKTKTKIKT